MISSLTCEFLTNYLKSVSLPFCMYVMRGYFMAMTFGRLGRVLDEKQFGCRCLDFDQ